MMDEKKQNIIIFNGEIYNYEKIRNELNKKDNIQYITNSDTEVLLHFIKSNMNNMKFSFLKELRGIFGAVFYSKELKKIFIFNDRFGIKPIYIYKKIKMIFFLEVRLNLFIPFLDEKLAININAIKNYITYIYAPGDVTPLEKVTSLPPGSIFTIEVETGKTSLSSWLPNNYEFPNKKNFFL